MLQLEKGSVVVGRPGRGDTNIFLRKRMQRGCDLGVVFDEASMIANETKELLDASDVSGLGNLLYSSNLRGVKPNSITANDVT